MTSSRLPYPWKVVVAAAVVAVLLVGVTETRRRWRKKVPAVPAPSTDVTANLYEVTLARTRQIIALHTSSVEEIVTPDMPLVDLGIDPLTRVEVADALETAYGIQLTNEELAGATTVDDLVNLVVQKRQAPAIHSQP